MGIENTPEKTDAEYDAEEQAIKDEMLTMPSRINAIERNDELSEDEKNTQKNELTERNQVLAQQFRDLQIEMVGKGVFERRANRVME